MSGPCQLVIDAQTAIWGVGVWGTFVWGADGLDIYTLPESLIFSDDDFTMRHEEQIRALANGAAVYGEQINSRDIVLQGDVWAASEAAAIALMREIKARMARPNQRLRLGPTEGCYINLAKAKTGKFKYKQLAREHFVVQLTWSAADPFWYSETPDFALLTAVKSRVWTVNTGTGTHPARVPVYPVFTMTAPQHGAIHTFTLRNDSDGGLQFTYSDLALANGARVRIDSLHGTVLFQAAGSTAWVNKISAFSGEFMRLLPGVNSLQYTGPLVGSTVNTAQADTYVYEGNPTTNYVSSGILAAGRESAPNAYLYRTYLAFNSSAFTAPITSATLRLNREIGYSAPTFQVHRITETWAADAITWATQPAFDPTPVATAVIAPNVNGWYEFDITDLLEQWRNGTHPNYGLVVRTNEVVSDTVSNWTSSDSSATASRPQLVVTTEAGYLRADWVPAWL